jgi:L-alanine-DL-glutamate epimerase-like enolase superfamily enzyme
MKIKKIEYFRYDLKLTEPYTIAYETVDHSTNIILRIETDSGISGWGCSAPDLPVTGETPEDVTGFIDNELRGMLLNQSPFEYSRINHEIRQKFRKYSSARAMVDMALLDAISRRAKVPLYKLLGGLQHSIPTSITIGILPLEETLEQARRFISQGFYILKLKGGINLEEDIAKITKIREKFGKGIILRFDANQGYSSAEAIEFINRTQNSGIEILEQPTNLEKEFQLGIVSKNINVPVMADESLKTLKDAFRLASNELVDMINIKIMKVGGITEAQHINSVAKAAGLEAMVGCLDECALGISAGLHFALSRPNVEFADLDGNLDLLNDPFKDLFKLKDGVLYPSRDFGLGKIVLK